VGELLSAVVTVRPDTEIRSVTRRGLGWPYRTPHGRTIVLCIRRNVWHASAMMIAKFDSPGEQRGDKQGDVSADDTRREGVIVSARGDTSTSGARRRWGAAHR
jgi:hypothetical protein